jgi:hypothetical protein
LFPSRNCTLYQACLTLADSISVQFPQQLRRKRWRTNRFGDQCMSATNQRTWQQYRVGQFLCTVQLDPVADGKSVEGPRELAGVVRRLIGLMDSLRLPATWAVSDPAHSGATALVLRSAAGHEMAILGDAHWLGPTAGRTRFARELTRRVSQARAAGIDVCSLVPRVAPIERHIDLIVKQQICAVAGVSDPSSDRQLATPRAMHYGVWEVPVAASLPMRSGWFSIGRWSTWKRIRRTARDAATFHLMVDLPAIAQAGPRAEKTVAWLMRRVAELRDRGLMQVETLQGAAARLADVPTPSPQQSILRRAA